MSDADRPTDDSTPDPTGIDARLSAADPTFGQPEPDLARLTERVLADDRTSADASAEVIPLRRRHPALLVGAAAAGVAVLAGATLGGVAIGRGTAPNPAPLAAAPEESAATDSLPVVGAPAGQPAADRAPGMQPGIQPGLTSDTSAAATDMRMGLWTSDLVPGPDLADDAGTATGYRVVADGVDPAALARQVAEAFGVDGEPVRDGESWRVGDYDVPMVWVGVDSLASWSFSDPTADPWSCYAVDGTVEDTDEPEIAAEGSGESRAGEPCPRPIGERDARQQTERILAGLGVTDASVRGVGVEWETYSDEVTTTVTAWQTVEGSRTQLTWSVTFDAEGPIWAGGFAAGLEPVAGYPVVGARTAVERSAQPQWAAFGPTPLDGVVMPMADTGVTAQQQGTARPSTGNPSSIQIWWDPITVTDAELTLAQYWQPDGTLMILPAYRLQTADDRGVWAVIAVADSAVTFTTP